jgi:Tfp pilus assembly protein PilO
MTKREKIMIGAAVSAVMFVCFYMFFYQPEKKELLRLQEEIKTVALEIDRIVRAIPGLRNLEEEVAREQKSASLVKRIPSGEKPVQELLRQLAGEASRLDMDVISLKSGEGSESPHEESPYKRLTVVMNIQCTYRHLSSYLKGINELPGLVTVDELEIVRDNQIFPRVKVKLTLGVWVTI